MALLHSFEKSGNQLFKYRGQLPIFIFVIAIPVILCAPIQIISCTLQAVVTSLAVLLSVIGLAIRSYTIATTPANTSGRNTDKQIAETINTSGIYSMLRHPLYLGNYLMWIGIVLFTFNAWFILLISLIYWLYYERIMFAEERFLEYKFGEAFTSWSLKVPAFIPSLKNYKNNEVPFSFKSVLRREYSGVGAMAFGFMFVDLLRDYAINNTFCMHRLSVYVFIGAMLLVLVLRTLKHHTKVLFEEGRS